MRVLLDECLPRRLKRDISHHEVSTVVEAGWSGKKNGELLALIQNRFDVFITIDKNMSYQQKLSRAACGFIVLKSKSNRYQDIKPTMRHVQAVLSKIQPGEVIFL